MSRCFSWQMNNINSYTCGFVLVPSATGEAMGEIELSDWQLSSCCFSLHDVTMRLAHFNLSLLFLCILIILDKTYANNTTTTATNGTTPQNATLPSPVCSSFSTSFWCCLKKVYTQEELSNGFTTKIHWWTLDEGLSVLFLVDLCLWQHTLALS